ncbi:hypothetical protein [Acidiplasma aeolicum]|jgi:hypothetical protein|uniref:hypothetical protein n=1 Tax=Acidiplasma aeolicum TaxID=507754 RepID=UPI00370F9989
MNNYDNVDNNSSDVRNTENTALDHTMLMRSYKYEHGNLLYDACAGDLGIYDIYKTLKGSKKMYHYIPEFGYYRDDS